jgi:hypothetical protein
MGKRIVLDASAKLAAAAQDAKALAAPDSKPAVALALPVDSIGAKLMESITRLANATNTQTSRLDPNDRKATQSAARLTREVAGTWALVHAELRASLQAMSDEKFREQLASLAQVVGVDPPSPPGAGATDAHEANINFSEIKPSILPTPTLDALKPQGTALLDFDDEEDHES